MQAERLRTGQQSLVSTLVATAAIAQKAKSALSSAASASSVFRSYVVVQSKPRGSSSWSHSDVYRDESGSGGFTEANRALVELSRASDFTGHLTVLENVLRERKRRSQRQWQLLM